MSAPHVTVHPATDNDQPALRQLMQLYLYDFSEFEHVPLNDDGLFGHREFIEEQFSPTHDAYVVRAGGHLAGFAIVTRGSYLAHDLGVTDMTQFFIVRACRKRGVGASAAQQLFSEYPGSWEVRVVDTNAAARAFWRETISRYTQSNFAESRADSPRHKGPVFSFTSAARP